MQSDMSLSRYIQPISPTCWLSSGCWGRDRHLVCSRRTFAGIREWVSRDRDTVITPHTGRSLMSATKRSTVVGVFEDRQQADRAVAELHQAGFREDQIGLAMRQTDGSTDTGTTSGETYA